MLQRLFILFFLLTLSFPAFAGFDEGKQAYDKKDWLTAIKNLRPLAESGDDRAMILLANMYANGYGVVPSHEEALKLYKRAATEKNNPQAMDAIGAAYISATGVDQNLQTALQWFHRSALLGDQIGAFFCATLLAEGNKTKPNELKPDPYTAYKWYRIAAAEKQNAVFQRYAGKIADGIAAKKLLTAEQLAKADKEAAAWKPVAVKNLGPVPVDPPQSAKKLVPVPPELLPRKHVTPVPPIKSPDIPLARPAPSQK